MFDNMYGGLHLFLEVSCVLFTLHGSKFTESNIEISYTLLLYCIASCITNVSEGSEEQYLDL